MKKIASFSLITAVVISVQAAPINILKENSLSADHGGTKVAIDAYSDGAGAIVIGSQGGEKVDNSPMNTLVFKYGEDAKAHGTTIVNEVKVLNTASSSIEKALADRIIANAASTAAVAIPAATGTCAGGYQGAYNPSIDCSGSTIAGNLSSGWLNLTSVGGYLYLHNKPTLTNLDSLANLTNIGGSFYLYGNNAITNLNGLVNLTSVGGVFIVNNNSVLSDISGLANLTYITNFVQFDNRTYETKLPASSYLCRFYWSKILFGGSYATATTKLQVCNP